MRSQFLKTRILIKKNQNYSKMIAIAFFINKIIVNTFFNNTI